jgi:hypothetical protein
MSNRTLGFVAFCVLVIAVLCVALAAAIITGTADAAGECPHPPLRPQIYMPIVSQCRGVYCDYGGWLNEVTK